MGRLAEDISWRIPGDHLVSGNFSGHDEILAFFQQINELAGGTFSVDVHEILESASGAVVALTTISAQRDGRRASFETVHVWQLQGAGRRAFASTTTARTPSTRSGPNPAHGTAQPPHPQSHRSRRCRLDPAGDHRSRRKARRRTRATVMISYLRGRTPWAVVLCRFSDVPEPGRPRSYFENFFTETGAGTGGLWDYWKDVSNGALDLSGSVVVGWYTMQYAFRERWRGDRTLWIDEAIRLAERDLDLRNYFGVVAVVNAPVEDSALGLLPKTFRGRLQECGLLALNMSESMGQTAWRHCGDCQGLYYAGHQQDGKCPSDPTGVREHRPSASTIYVVVDGPGRLPDPHESGWRWCSKCEGLWYEPGLPAPCPGGGTHVSANSAAYELVYNLASFPYQSGFRRCRRCRGLAHEGSTGACPAGGRHAYDTSRDYTMLRDESHVEVMMAAHEMGHGFGFGHSFRSGTPDVEYGDPWDIMSATSVKTFYGRRGTSGPGLNAASLMKLGWLPEARTDTTGSSIVLAPLNRSERPGALAVRLRRADRVYTAELRSGSGWDTGVTEPAVLIHELRAGYSTGQNGWRWCRRCEGLFYAGAAACPRGGVHAVADGAEYVVAMDDPSAAGQRDWRWCRKCQALVFAGQPLAQCPGGGLHALDQSANYTVILDDRSPARRDDYAWRHCVKCHCLVGRRAASCVVGGAHEYVDGSQYRVEQPALLFGPSGQPGWRACRKCESLFYWGAARCAAGGLHDHVGSLDYSLGLNDSSAAGQAGWRWCRKCQGLAFNRPGRCPTGGAHDYSQSGEYKIAFAGASTAVGQRNWRWCARCEGLAFADREGKCPASGGAHSFTSPQDYALVSFGDDPSYLKPSMPSRFDWPPGSVFEDSTRGLRIAVQTVSADSARLSITTS